MCELVLYPPTAELSRGSVYGMLVKQKCSSLAYQNHFMMWFEFVWLPDSVIPTASHSWRTEFEKMHKISFYSFQTFQMGCNSLSYTFKYVSGSLGLDLYQYSSIQKLFNPNAKYICSCLPWMSDEAKKKKKQISLWKLSYICIIILICTLKMKTLCYLLIL